MWHRHSAGETVQQIFIGNITSVFMSETNGASTTTQAICDNLSNARPYEDIPGPKPLPIFGNALRFIPGIGELAAHTDEDLHKSLYEQYGKIVKITGIPGRSDIVILFDPDDIEKVFRNDGPSPFRLTALGLRHYRMVTRKNIFEGIGGLITSQGDEWHNFRKKVNPVIMQPRSTKQYVGPIDSVANDFIHRIRILQDNKQEMPEDFNNEMLKWALESIAYIILDSRLGCLEKDLNPDSEAQKLIDAVGTAFDAGGEMENGLPIWKYISTPTWRAFVKASDYMLESTVKFINEAKKRLNEMPEDTDRERTALEKLLIRDPDPKSAIVMVNDLIGGGVHTTSVAVAMALYYLAKFPKKQQILFEEIVKFLPDKEQPVTSEILKELKYLKACIKESMRMSHIFPVNNRKLFKDLQLAGYRVPKGTNILMPYKFLSNEEQYFQEAKEFIPERWLKDGQYSNMKKHSFATMPFGFGPRMCAGKGFAELEIEILVAKLIRNFRVAYNYGDMKFRRSMLYTPINPLKFQMVDREN